MTTAEKYFNQGCEEICAKRWTDASIDFINVIKLDPNFEAAYYYKGICNYEQKKIRNSN